MEFKEEFYKKNSVRQTTPRQLKCTKL